MTVKQRKFCNEYIKTGNATQSAIKAGYSKKTASFIGAENLNKPYLRDYIEKKMQSIIAAEDKQTIASATEVLEFLTRQMRREEMEQVVSTKKEKVTKYNNEGKRIVEETQEPVVIEIKTRNTDALKASEMLARHFSILSPADVNENEISKVDILLGSIEEKSNDPNE